MLVLETTTDVPEETLFEFTKDFKESKTALGFLACHYDLKETWLTESDQKEVALSAYYLLTKKKTFVSILAMVTTGQEKRFVKTFSSKEEAILYFISLADAFKTPLIDFAEPIKLCPIDIPKPWGKEVWYTGMEKRGLSLVMDKRGEKQFLPWVLSMAPHTLVGGKEKEINLLKILDPFSHEVYGDLYYEMHERKKEVYLVTHISKQAWPSGVGFLRYGFDEAVLNEYQGDRAGFKKAYLDCVKAYERVRREIDQFLDKCRQKEKIDLKEAVLPEKLLNWQKQLPKDLLKKEETLRKAMNLFTGKLPLKVGDVVAIDPFISHSLQHGVQTIEFQTPFYERAILSFGQKVLTQDHWDTKKAIEQVKLVSPKQSVLKINRKEEAFLEEQIADFDDFKAFRVTLKKESEYLLQDFLFYGLLIVVTGELHFKDQVLKPLESVLLSKPLVGSTFRSGEGEIVFAIVFAK